MAHTRGVEQSGKVGKLLAFSPEEDRLRGQLLEVLPEPPHPGKSKQQILDELYGPEPHAAREAYWGRIYRVILKTRRMQENRFPKIPLIMNTGRTSRDPRYQLMGYTGEDGEPCIFEGAIQLEHARIRRLRDLRRRATSASELLALKYFADMVDAIDRGQAHQVKDLSRRLAQESLFILPVLSLLGQVMGVPYQQARPLGELVEGFQEAITGHRGYDLMLGKPIERLHASFKKDWPRVEGALAQMINQLMSHAVLKRGSGSIRAELAARAESAAYELADASEESAEDLED